MKFVLKTNKPIAFDSPDYFASHVPKDYSRNPLFNKKLNTLFNQSPLYVLDLGCAGGGFVKDCLDDGHFALGLEGSDYCQKTGIGDWRKIQANLFTCDITGDFSLYVVHESGIVEVAKFDVVTAWEVMEHIRTSDLMKVCANVKKHLARGGIWVLSISPNEQVFNGVKLHQTVQKVTC